MDTSSELSPDEQMRLVMEAANEHMEQAWRREEWLMQETARLQQMFYNFHETSQRVEQRYEEKFAALGPRPKWKQEQWIEYWRLLEQAVRDEFGRWMASLLRSHRGITYPCGLDVVLVLERAARSEQTTLLNQFCFDMSARQFLSPFDVLNPFLYGEGTVAAMETSERHGWNMNLAQQFVQCVGRQQMLYHAWAASAKTLDATRELPEEDQIKAVQRSLADSLCNTFSVFIFAAVCAERSNEQAYDAISGYCVKHISLDINIGLMQTLKAEHGNAFRGLKIELPGALAELVAAQKQSGKDTPDLIRNIPGKVSYRIEKRLEREPHSELVFDEKTPDDNDFVKAFLSKQTVDAFQREINLPKREMQVFELVYLEGQTEAEIAQRLGMAVGTVRSNKARIAEKLKCVRLNQYLCTFFKN